MIENLLIYACIAFSLYLVFDIKKPKGEVTDMVQNNYSAYKFEQLFGA